MKLFNKKLNNTTTQRGWMSMEMMFVLAMVAVVTSFVIFYFYKLNQDRKANDTISLITLINQKVQELYAQDNNYNGIEPGLLINTGALNKANFSGDKILNSWKGEIDLSSVNNDVNYQLKIKEVPKEQCSKIAGAFRNQAEEIKINDDEKVSTVAKIVEKCNLDNNAITLIFK